MISLYRCPSPIIMDLVLHDPHNHSCLCFAKPLETCSRPCQANDPFCLPLQVSEWPTEPSGSDFQFAKRTSSLTGSHFYGPFWGPQRPVEWSLAWFKEVFLVINFTGNSQEGTRACGEVEHLESLLSTVFRYLQVGRNASPTDTKGCLYSTCILDI